MQCQQAAMEYVIHWQKTTTNKTLLAYNQQKCKTECKAVRKQLKKYK
jgi:hypothetical protein